MSSPRIARHEVEISGKWITVGRRVEADDNCRRIQELVEQHLQELGRDETGWDPLFLDPDDGRLWELTYPQSELHGGGPPRLRLLDELDVRSKYRHLKPRQ